MIGDLGLMNTIKMSHMTEIFLHMVLRNNIYNQISIASRASCDAKNSVYSMFDTLCRAAGYDSIDLTQPNV